MRGREDFTGVSLKGGRALLADERNSTEHLTARRRQVQWVWPPASRDFTTKEKMMQVQDSGHKLNKCGRVK